MWRLYLTLTSSFLHLYVQKMGMTKIGKAKKTSISKHYMHHICTLIVHVHTNIIIAISTLLRSNSTLFRNKKRWISYLFFPKTCPTFGIILGYTIFRLGTSWRHWSSRRARRRISDLTFTCRGRIWGRWNGCFGGRTRFQFSFRRAQ